MISEERGINTVSLKLGHTQSQHDNFKNEKNDPQHYALRQGAHCSVPAAKFHCELNGIESVWGHSKRISGAYCDCVPY
jgi:hypothetical protein